VSAPMRTIVDGWAVASCMVAFVAPFATGRQLAGGVAGIPIGTATVFGDAAAFGGPAS
jgi:hypothetical protein